MFTILYELLAGPNPDPTYRDIVFPFIGLFTLIFALIFILVFYIVLGRNWPIWYKTSHWVITMIILLIIVYPFTVFNAESATGTSSDPYIIRLALANTFYVFIYYVIFSLIFKRFSIFAKRTPF